MTCGRVTESTSVDAAVTLQADVQGGLANVTSCEERLVHEPARLYGERESDSGLPSRPDRRTLCIPARSIIDVIWASETPQPSGQYGRGADKSDRLTVAQNEGLHAASAFPGILQPTKEWETG